MHTNPEPVTPWFTFDALEFLAGIDLAGKRVFEWGSGGSTVYFAQRADHVVSVEHNPIWFAKTGAMLTEAGLRNVTRIHRPPVRLYHPKYYTVDSCVSYANNKGYGFDEYVKEIYRHQKSDVIIVDGRARISCIKTAIDRLNPGGLIILDNSERTYYADGIRLLADFEAKHFYGHGAGSDVMWQTSFYFAK